VLSRSARPSLLLLLLLLLLPRARVLRTVAHPLVLPSPPYALPGPAVYSIFCLCEWLFVASNIGFLSAIFIDGVHWRVAVVDAADKRHSARSA